MGRALSTVIKRAGAVRPSRWSRYSTAIAGLAFSLAPVGLIFVPGMDSWRLGLAIAAPVFLLITILLSVSEFTLVTRMTDQGIERCSAFGREFITFDSIAGIREIGDSGFHIIHGPGRKLQFEIRPEMRLDPDWLDWLCSLTDLDATDRDAERRALEADARLGRSVEERRERIEGLRRWAPAANLTGLGIGLWGLIYPRPYEMAALACALAPLVAVLLAIRWRGAVALIHDTDDWAGGSVATLWMLPAICCALFGLRVTVVDWQAAMLAALGPAAVLAAFVALIDPKARTPFNLVFSAIIAFSWSWGAMVAGNDILDHRNPRIVEAQVTSKSGEAGDDPELGLYIPELQYGIESLPVSAGRFEAAEVGGTACLRLYPGRFGWRYVYAADCPAKPTTESSAPARPPAGSRYTHAPPPLPTAGTPGR